MRAQVAESVHVATQAFDEFFQACVERYGSKPAAWQRKTGETELSIFEPGRDSILDADEVMLQYPLAGG